jgi:hypothetical protein
MFLAKSWTEAAGAGRRLGEGGHGPEGAAGRPDDDERHGRLPDGLPKEGAAAQPLEKRFHIRMHSFLLPYLYDKPSGKHLENTQKPSSRPPATARIVRFSFFTLHLSLHR